MEEDYLYLGEIKLLPYNFAPKNLMLCDGRILRISDNPALYSLLGVKFGRDGREYFRLPNLKGTEPIPGMAYYIAVSGMYPQRT